MALKTVQCQPPHPSPLIYAEMPLAHQFCQGRGLELGASAHNPFNLPGALNVAPFSNDPAHPDYQDYVFFIEHQKELCGAYVEVDIAAEAHAIPLPDNSQDYILSSHVVEHLPNPIAAFLEWNRLLKPGGIVFMIFPKRDALSFDATRPITPLQEFIDDYQNNIDVDTHPITAEMGWMRRGHYHVFTLQSMLEIITWCNQNLNLGWHILYTEETDSKQGIGHTIVARYVGQARQLLLEEGAENGATSPPRQRLAQLFKKHRAEVERLISAYPEPDRHRISPTHHQTISYKSSNLRRVLVVCPDMPPFDGFPTTGAGLRAWGLGEGLRTNGYDVTYAIPKETAEGNKFTGDPRAVIFTNERFLEIVYQQRPDALIFQHWPLVNLLPEPYPYTIIDLHGPLLLETLFRAGEETTTYYHQKLKALSKGDFFTCAGERQRNYFYAWLSLAGFDLRQIPIDVVPFSLDPALPQHQYPADELQFVYGGLFLPWQDPVLGLRVLVEEMHAHNQGHLYFFGGNHPWVKMPPMQKFEQVKDLLINSPYTTISPAIPRDALIERYKSASLAWDVMSHNAERGMAFTSRTVEYLWTGLPVVYNNYAELADYIGRYEAGWLVDPTDEAQIRRTVQEIFANPSEIIRRGQNAQRLVSEQLNWQSSVAPIVNFLQNPEGRRAQRFSPKPYLIST